MELRSKVLLTTVSFLAVSAMAALSIFGETPGDPEKSQAEITVSQHSEGADDFSDTRFEEIRVVRKGAVGGSTADTAGLPAKFPGGRLIIGLAIATLLATGLAITLARRGEGGCRLEIGGSRTADEELDAGSRAAGHSGDRQDNNPAPGMVEGPSKGRGKGAAPDPGTKRRKITLSHSGQNRRIPEPLPEENGKRPVGNPSFPGLALLKGKGHTLIEVDGSVLVPSQERSFLAPWKERG